ncbi:MAG: hypothetical protein ABI353_20905 [Isosphaeraceae bacterium]
MLWSVGLWLGLLWFTAPTAPATEPPRFEEVTLQGEVVELSDALRTLGLPADPGLIAGQVVLNGNDGALTPILSDEASRALFKDHRLRDRQAELKGRLYAGLPYLQVTSFRVEQDGRLQTPEYYCDVCAIQVGYPQICPCCQGEMVLRMRPDAP